MKKLTYILTALLLLTSTMELMAQRRRRSEPATKSFPEAAYSSVKWRSIGPFRGGRAGTVAGVVGDRTTYYMGTAGGGVWKTEDAGNTWFCISDGYFGGSIGAVAVSESDPNVL